MTSEKITAKAEFGDYVVLSGIWFILSASYVCIGFFKVLENPYEPFFAAFFCFLLGVVIVFLLKGLRLEVSGDFFIYRNWFYVEKKFELKKISKIKEGWFETKRKFVRNTEIYGIRIKYDGRFVIINTKSFGGENYMEIIAALKKEAAKNFLNQKKASKN